ncbi:BRO family protein [Photobacterium leiognathi]|uniref:BRO family protein n=1 Tax=Photobacterium leiognathi TaxID=553611 RepID=UPI0027352AB2|nr:BRO family protein [Photobacterium leiognathi]
MGLSEVLLSYESAIGKDEGIRTFTNEGKLYFSLYDVVMTIQRENRFLEPNKNSKSILTLIKAHITHLLPKEIFIRKDLPENLDLPYQDSYVTKSGLLRVVLQDNSPACIKFQEWVLEDVLQSVLETGSYQHPNIRSSSLASIDDFDVETVLRIQLQETIERKRADAELKKEITSLGSKVELIEKVVKGDEMIFVHEDPFVATLSDKEQYEVFSYCLRLCSLEPQVYRSQRRNDISDLYSKVFSRNTVMKALADYK